MRRSDLVRRHPVRRISNTGELVQLAKLLIAQCIAVFGQRGVFFNFISRIAVAKTLDPSLFLAQSDEFILRIIAQRALNRVTRGFRYMNE